MSATLGTELVQQVATFLSAALQTNPKAGLQQHSNGRARAQGSSSAAESTRQSQGLESDGTASVPVIVSEGRSYDVERLYLGAPSGDCSWQRPQQCGDACVAK